MKLRARRHRRMLADLISHYGYIGRDSLSAADRFIEACEATIELLANHPQIGTTWSSPHEALEGIRIRTIVGFRNYVLFYRVVGDELEVLRVLHGAQDYSNMSDIIPRD